MSGFKRFFFNILYRKIFPNIYLGSQYSHRGENFGTPTNLAYLVVYVP